MRKLVVVINGSGGVGKDTICSVVAAHHKTLNYSSVDPIKKIAKDNGWNGEKTEKSRKFLSDLKKLFIDFNDLPLNYMLGRYREFLESDNEVLFLHIREAEEIEKLVRSIRELGGNVATLLIRGRNDANKAWHNVSDDAVENYRYDYIYDNVKSLDELDADFMAYFEANMVD